MSNLWKWASRKLGWGETPWDDMPREQLLREVQRMYSALISARGSLINGQRFDSENPYWKRGGCGGEAVEMVEQALSPYKGDHQGNGYEPAYDTFFRYANDLLFDGCGSNWMVCDNGDMVGSYTGKQHTVCELCRARGKGEVPMRPLQWSDLDPSKAKARAIERAHCRDCLAGSSSCEKHR